MPTNILMPALSPTMEKGNLAKWLKKEGDAIKSGDVIAEIETDKATMEVEAVDEGTLAKIVVPDGTADVPVNDVIGRDRGRGRGRRGRGGRRRQAAAPRRRGTGAASHRPASAASPDGLDTSVRPTTEPVAGSRAQSRASGATAMARGTRRRVFASPLARRVAKENGIDLGASRARARTAAWSSAT